MEVACPKVQDARRLLFACGFSTALCVFANVSRCERIPAIRTVLWLEGNEVRVADSAVTINSEGPVNRFEPVAGPLHTIFLLLALTAVAAFGFFTIGRVTIAENASHLRFYLPTIAWEWLVFGYI